MPPVRVPSAKPYFGSQEIDFILSNFRDILEGKGFLSQGKFCEQLEKEFTEYHGASFGISVSNGTAALEVMLRSVDVAGREVIVTANTFAATAFAIIRAGGIPVFADIGPDMTLDPASAEALITPRTKAILTVHIGGLVSPNTVLLADLCRRRGLALVEDCAHAHGSSFNGKKAGTFGAAGAFSFFSTKVMTTGEGGMVLTNNEGLARHMRILRDQAKVQKGIYQNYHEEVGYNWRMTEVQALLGLAQLHMLDKFIARRNEIVKIFLQEWEGLEDAGKVTLIRPPSEAVHNFYKFIVLLNGYDRELLLKRMREEAGVAMGGFVYEIPLHQQPAFKDYVRGRLPRAEDLCARHVCPPLFYTMSDEDTRYVAEAFRRCLQ